jgi:hypothetical protein
MEGWRRERIESRAMRMRRLNNAWRGSGVVRLVTTKT